MILDNYAEYLINNQDFNKSIRRIYRFNNNYGIVITKYPSDAGFTLKAIKFDGKVTFGTYFKIPLIVNGTEADIKKMFEQVMGL